MFDIIIGVFAIVLGILSALQRIFKPESSRKLVAMRKTYGEKAGSIVHFVSYTVVPVLFGIVILVRAFSAGA